MIVRDTAIKSLNLFLTAEQVTEVRVLDAVTRANSYPHVESGYFNDAGKLVDSLGNITSAKGIYVIPNPVNPDLLARSANRMRPARKDPLTSDSDITERHWLLIDCDPVRPSGISATEEEKAIAFDKACEVYEALKTAGWPEPIFADSGNGYHLMYRINLPVDDGGLVQKCLDAIAQKHQTDTVTIDRTVYNPARIWKLYGTRACKGDSVNGRPHRMSDLISAPDPIETVPTRLLEELALAAEKKAPPPTRRTSGPRGKINDSPEALTAFLAEHGVTVQRVEDGKAGSHVLILDGCPMNGDHGQGTDTAVILTQEGVIGFECKHNGCANFKWSDVRAKIDPDKKTPEQRESRKPIEIDGDPIEAPVPNAVYRPEMRIGVRDDITIPEAAAVLTEDTSLFQRARTLVRVARCRAGGPDEKIRNLEGTPIIIQAPQSDIGMVLTRRRKLVRWDKRAEEWQPIRPPTWLLTGVMNLGDWEGVPDLASLSDAPVLDHAGRIHQTAGLDRTTGVYYDPQGAEFPEIPDNITQEDAADAASRLFEVVENFPFISDAHRSAWLAALLTPVARFAFTGPSPLFLFDANVRGAGKSLLAQTVGAIVSGRKVPTMKYTDSDELEKRITTLALRGVRMILLDNVTGTFGDPTLDLALTSTQWAGRLLGRNDADAAVDIPLWATWYATSNNAVVGADTLRRIIHVRLVVPEEYPEDREGFAHPNLMEWITENRPRLLADALTILAGFIRSGKKPGKPIKSLGSFEDWSAVVAGACVWAGQPDPVETNIEFRSTADTVFDEIAMLMDAWQESYPGDAHATVLDVMERCYPSYGQPPSHSSTMLREAVEAIVGNPPGRTPSPRQLGTRLRTIRNRTVNGRCFVQHGVKTKRGIAWRLEDADPFRS